MDNQYTKKELKCPLANNFCDKEDKDCNRCIVEEDEYQKEQNIKN